MFNFFSFSRTATPDVETHLAGEIPSVLPSVIEDSMKDLPSQSVDGAETFQTNETIDVSSSGKASPVQDVDTYPNGPTDVSLSGVALHAHNCNHFSPSISGPEAEHPSLIDVIQRRLSKRPYNDDVSDEQSNNHDLARQQKVRVVAPQFFQENALQFAQQQASTYKSYLDTITNKDGVIRVLQEQIDEVGRRYQYLQENFLAKEEEWNTTSNAHRLCRAVAMETDAELQQLTERLQRLAKEQGVAPESSIEEVAFSGVKRLMEILEANQIEDERRLQQLEQECRILRGQLVDTHAHWEQDIAAMRQQVDRESDVTVEMENRLARANTEISRLESLIQAEGVAREKDRLDHRTMCNTLQSREEALLRALREHKERSTMTADGEIPGSQMVALSLKCDELGKLLEIKVSLVELLKDELQQYKEEARMAGAADCWRPHISENANGKQREPHSPDAQPVAGPSSTAIISTSRSLTEDSPRTDSQAFLNVLKTLVSEIALLRQTFDDNRNDPHMRLSSVPATPRKATRPSSAPATPPTPQRDFVDAARGAMNVLLGINKGKEIIDAIKMGHSLSEHDYESFENGEMDIADISVAFMKPYWATIKCNYNFTLGKLFSAFFLGRFPECQVDEARVLAYFIGRLKNLRSIYRSNLYPDDASESNTDENSDENGDSD